MDQVIMVKLDAPLVRRVVVLIPTEPKVMVHYLGLPPVDSQWEEIEQAVTELRAEGYIMLMPESDLVKRERAIRAEGLAIFVGSVVLIAGLLWINAQKLPLLGPQLGWSFAAVVLAIAAGSLAYWLAMHIRPAGLPAE